MKLFTSLFFGTLFCYSANAALVSERWEHGESIGPLRSDQWDSSFLEKEVVNLFSEAHRQMLNAVEKKRVPSLDEFERAVLQKMYPEENDRDLQMTHRLGTRFRPVFQNGELPELGRNDWRLILTIDAKNEKLDFADDTNVYTITVTDAPQVLPRKVRYSNPEPETDSLKWFNSLLSTCRTAMEGGYVPSLESCAREIMKGSHMKAFLQTIEKVSTDVIARRVYDSVSRDITVTDDTADEKEAIATAAAAEPTAATTEPAVIEPAAIKPAARKRYLNNYLTHIASMNARKF